MDALALTLAATDPTLAARPALFAEGRCFTWAELAARVTACREKLLTEGLHPGARVALIAQNRVPTVIAIHALLELGATIVPVHPRLTPIEAQVVLDDAAPARVLRDPDLALLTADEAPILSPPTRAIDLETPLAMVYTSGTTGRPKGAVLTRRAFLASAAASGVNLGWRDDDRWLLCLPLCHVGGLSIITRCLIARRAVILEPRFDPDALLASLTRDRATLLSVVPTMLAALLDRDHENALASLRAILVGGAATPPALLAECARRRILALTTYGLTEACSQVTSQRPRAPGTLEPGSGAPLPGVDLRIVSDAGSPASPGEIGRIQVRGPTLMRGYRRGEGALDPSTNAEGWFETGDLGALDDAGNLHVHARRTDLIVTGGENVYPIEIEQRLESFPGVRRALVFGVPDDRWGQIVAAAIEAAPDLGLAALSTDLVATLAAHKRPRLVCLVEALPLTSSGKLDRSGARARFEPLLKPLPAPPTPLRHP